MTQNFSQSLSQTFNNLMLSLLNLIFLLPRWISTSCVAIYLVIVNVNLKIA